MKMQFLTRSFSPLRKLNVVTGTAGSNHLETQILTGSLGLVLHLRPSCIMQLQMTNIGMDATEHHLDLGTILVDDGHLVNILANDPSPGTVDIQGTVVLLGTVVTLEIDDLEMVHNIAQGTILGIVLGTLQGMVQDIILDEDPTIGTIVQVLGTAGILLIIEETIDVFLVTGTGTIATGTDVPSGIHQKEDTEAMIEGTVVPIDTGVMNEIEAMTGTDSHAMITVPVPPTGTIRRHIRKISVKRKKGHVLIGNSKLTLLTIQRLRQRTINRRKTRIIPLTLWN